ncbi:MAG: energy-coupling factor transporter transmembrane component T [Desulfobacterales bacterium]|jgi:energy-coupling factor transport system permease protein
MKRFDPRTKLALGVMAIGAVLVSREAVTLIAECVIVLAIFTVMRKDGKLSESLRLMIPMVSLVFIMGIIFFDIKIAFLLSTRLFNLLTVSIIFFRAITPEEMGDALKKLGIPFGLVFILTTGMRYVPLIGKKIRSIIDAQQARGIDLRPRVKNIKNFMALLMPLLVQSFLLSDELALAMESRGFGCKHRSSRRQYHLSIKEITMMAICLALLAVLYWVERG